MELEKLARILAQMYGDAEDDSSTMVRLFGIRYAHEIRGKHTPRHIIQYAKEHLGLQITDTYDSEINKGVTLSRYVIDKESLINHINDFGIGND